MDPVWSNSKRSRRRIVKKSKIAENHCDEHLRPDPLVDSSARHCASRAFEERIRLPNTGARFIRTIAGLQRKSDSEGDLYIHIEEALAEENDRQIKAWRYKSAEEMEDFMAPLPTSLGLARWKLVGMIWDLQMVVDSCCATQLL